MASPQHIRSINLDTSSVPKNKKTKKKRVHYSKKELEEYSSKLSNFDKNDIEKVLAKHQIKLKKFSKETEKFLDQVKEKVEAKKAKKTQKKVRFKEKSPELTEVIERPQTPELREKYIKPPSPPKTRKQEPPKKEQIKREDNNIKVQQENGIQFIEQLLKQNEPNIKKPIINKPIIKKEDKSEDKSESKQYRSETPDLKAKVLNKIAIIKEKHPSPKLKIQTYNQNQSLRRVVGHSRTQIAPHTTKGQLNNLYYQLDFHSKHLEKEKEYFQKKADPKLMRRIIQRKEEVKKLLENINQLEKIVKPVPKYQPPKPTPKPTPKPAPRIEIQPRVQSPKFKAIEVKGSIKELEALNSESLKKQLHQKIEKKEEQKQIRKEKEKEILKTNYLDQLSQRKDKYLQTKQKKSSYNPKVSQLKKNRHPVRGSYRNPHKRKLRNIIDKTVSKLRYQQRKMMPSPKPRYVFKETEGDIDFQKNSQKWVSRIAFLPEIDSMMMENFYIRNNNLKKYLMNLTFESILLV